MTDASAESLLNRVDEMLELADRVQDESESDASGVLEQLRRLYSEWYASALHFIPDSERKSFESEYNGGFPSYKIKHFLQSGLKRQVGALADLVAQGTLSKWQFPVDTAFQGPLMAQRQTLLNVYRRPSGSTSIGRGLDRLEATFRRLPQVLAVLRAPVHGRPGIAVLDEYDLQRVVHAALCLDYRDVRPEEYGPSRAGARPRIDFLLKAERIAVETKMTREGLNARRLSNELAEDIFRYRRHPDVDAYFALIHDPDFRITNSHGFESDFLTEKEFPTKVVIVN